MDSGKPSGMDSNLHEKEVTCSVCYQRKRSTVLMIPGRLYIFKVNKKITITGFITCKNCFKLIISYSCIIPILFYTRLWPSMTVHVNICFSSKANIKIR